MKLAPPVDLTVPKQDSTTTYELLSKYLQAQYRVLVGLGERVGIDASHVELKGLVAQARLLSERDPGILFSVLRRPTVGGPLRCLHNSRTNGQDRVTQLLSLLMSQLYFELAMDGVMVHSGPIARPPQELISLGSRRTLALGPGVQHIEFDGTRLSAESHAGTREYDLTDLDSESLETSSKLPLIRDGLVLSLIDNNPQSELEAHPEKSGNAVDLGERPISQWMDSLREALALVEQFLPEVDREIKLLVHQVIPVGYHEERHMSASYQEVIGNIYMTLHPDPLTMAEAIVHEFSHNKINMLFTLDAVLENAFFPLYSSPIRPDPRPLHGVLLAVHAFLPVERMYERMCSAGHPLSEHPRFKARQQQVRENNQAATETVLENGKATPIGRGVLDEIAQWNRYFAGGGSESGASAVH